jgi:phosphoenolpyruvate-protein phosphotransferase
VVVSTHLVPSLTVHLEREKILGFATEKGGYTSHAAILARSLGIPAVTGLDGIADDFVPGHTAVVDGIDGQVILNPDGRQKKRYKRLARRFSEQREGAISHATEPAVTSDGHDITVRANIGRAPDIELGVKYEAKGVGLYRTEFTYLSESSLPDEELLVKEYSRVATAFGEKGVALRVLDLGGDKFPPALPLAHEENPFIGLRGLRLLLEHVEDLLLPQLRAMGRASEEGSISILYPMVAGLEDFLEVQSVWERAREELEEEGYSIAPDIEQGIMIEVPSAVPVLGELLERVDYATVGTNDLVQYTLAADRNSERMMEAYDPCHPSVVRLLKQIARVGEEKGKKISICGEVGSDLSYLPLLLGLGYEVLSVNVHSIPHVRQTIRELSVEKCRDVAADVLEAETVSQVDHILDEFMIDSDTRGSE